MHIRVVRLAITVALSVLLQLAHESGVTRLALPTTFLNGTYLTSQVSTAVLANGGCRGLEWRPEHDEDIYAAGVGGDYPAHLLTRRTVTLPGQPSFSTRRFH